MLGLPISKAKSYHLPEKSRSREVEIEVRRLDRYLEENRLDTIRMIKIDVEGFELPVLKGFDSYL